MAKGTTVGFLNFGIDGDNKELMKKLDQAKKEAISVQQIMQDIMRTRSQSTNTQTGNEARRNALNQSRIQEIQTRSLERQRIQQEQLAREVLRTERLRQQMNSQSTASQNSLTNAIGMTNKTVFSQRNLLMQMSQALGIYFSIYQVGNFVKELANVSGEFEKQRASLAAILQDTDAATKIFNQVKELAVVSPFNFKELTDYAKQLSAFSIPTNEIFDTMKRLADVSAGLGVDMNRIILAYGQVRSASVLRGQELRQFTEAGIPLVDELAKKFGELEGRVVSAGAVFDKISNREVPFAMIKEIFTDLTSEGGKFYQMQEVQSATLAGKISNLRDNYDMMLDSIGQANKGLLHGAMDSIVNVMDNWEKYWKILKAIILTYGTYKAVIIAVSAAQKGLVAFEQITFFINLTRALNGTSIATSTLTLATNGLKAALATNPIGILAVGLSALAGIAIMASENIKDTSEVIADLSKTAESYANSIDSANNKTDNLLDTYNELTGKTSLNEKEQTKLRDTMEALAKTVPNAASEFDEYGRILSINTDIIKQYTADQKKYLKEGLENEIEEAEKRKNELLKQQAVFTDIITNGLKGTQGGTDGFKETRTALSNNQLEEYQNKRAEITKNLIQLDNEIIKSRRILSGVLDEPIADKNELSNWQKELKMILGDTLTIQVDSNIPSVIKELKEKHKDLKADLENQKPILIKFGFDFNEGKFPFPASPIAQQQAENYLKTQEEINRVNNAAKALNITLDDKKKKTDKDKFTEDLKNQVELIKSAKSEYEKLLKLMPKDQAGKALTGIKEYAEIDLSSLTDEGYIKYLNSMLTKLGDRNTDAAKNVRISWNKELGQIQVEHITDKAKSELDKIEKYLSQYKDKYSLYESIFNITGDKGQAAQLAFGDPRKQVDDYLSVLKDAFKQSSGISFNDFLKLDDKSQKDLFDQDDLKKLYDQIQSESWDSRADLSKRMAGLISEYATVEEKITAIQKNYADERQKIKDSENSTESKNAAIEALGKEEEDKINKLKEELFTLTDYYRKIFGDMSDITFDGLKNMVVKGEEILKSAIPDYDKDRKLKGYKVTMDGKETSVPIQAFERFRKKIVELRADVNKDDPFSAIKNNIDKLKSGEIDLKTFAKAVAVNFSDVMDIANDVGQSLSSMFSALGDESSADTIGFVLELGGAFSQMATDLASGNPVQQVAGVVKGIASVVSSIANFHDKKLDRAIKKSQLEVKKLQGSYEQMERFISRQLGAVTEKQAKDQIKNLKAQQAELNKQMDAENKKKKTDQSAIQDYKNSISELQDQIKYFYEDLLDEEYGLNLKSIADQLSSSLVEAFKSGENAAKSFDNTVADIINNLAQKMITMQIMEPAMQKIREYLFGSNGVFNDGELSVTDASGLVGLMGGLKDKIGESKAVWGALNEAAKKVGIDLGQTSVKDTLSKGIQSVPEDTANLLASYLNAIRADVAATRQIITQLIQISQTNSNTFALQLAELVKIQVNTFNTANNTAQIASTTQATYDLLKAATVPSGGTKFNMS